jgi:hypothetical protein
MNDEALYGIIEARYGFLLPDEYREMRRRGWIGGTYESDFLGPINAEWLSLEEIADYDFGRDVKEGARPPVVPFAMDGGHNPWCWFPARATDGGVPIAFCYFGDCSEARLDSPSFLGFCYRQLLDYLSQGDYVPKGGDPQYIERWRNDWSTLFPPSWRQVLSEVTPTPSVEWDDHGSPCRGYIHPDENKRIVLRDLAFPNIDRWVRV